MWDVASDRSVASFEGHTGSVDAVAFSPDGRMVASGAGFGDSSIRMWDAETKKPLPGFTRQAEDEDVGAANALAFSPDGKLLASGSDDGTALLWDVRRRTLRGAPILGHEDRVSDVDFAPDGRTLITAGYDGTVRFWNTRTGRASPAPIAASGPITAVAVSPDGRTLATAGDEFVQLWTLPARRPLGVALKATSAGIGALAARVWDVAFSPDGATLATGAEDGSARFWDVALRRQLGETVRAHRAGVTSLAFSADGKRLASASDDETVLIWDGALWGRDLDEFKQRICAGVRHDLTRDEWAEYLPGRAYHRSCPSSP